MRTFVALTMSLVWSWSASAQEPPVRAGEKVHVHTISTGEILRGVVLETTHGVLRVRLDGRRVDVPLPDIKRLEVEVRDSPREGAVAGALALGVLCALICGQGLDSAGDLPQAVLFNAAVGAAVGGLIDSAVNARRTVYEGVAPSRASALPKALPLVRLRF